MPLSKSTKKVASFLPNNLALIAIIFIILLTICLPKYFVATNTPKNMVYTGQAHWFDPWDINVYIAALKWSQTYKFNFQNSYTTTPHSVKIFYPLYTLLGILFPKTDVFSLFNAAAVFFGSILIFTICKCVNIFGLKHKISLLAVYLISLGGGLGWYVFPKIKSADVSYTPFTFYSSLQRPHENLALAAYIASLSLFYLAIKKQKISLIKWSTPLYLLFILFYPYYLLSFYLIIASFSVFFAASKNKQYPLYFFLKTLGFTLPFGILYSIYLLSGNSFESVLNPDIGRPHTPEIFFGYGILVFFLLYQLIKKNKSDQEIFLLLWFTISLLLNYTPLSFSRYFLRGLFFPLVTISLITITDLEKIHKILTKITLAALFLIIPLSTYFIGGQIVVHAKYLEPKWFYITKEENDALKYLDSQTPYGSGVLSSYILGNYIPTKTNNRVYYGHNHQTPNSSEKVKLLTKFYSNEFSDDEAKKFLIENNINYIIWGPEEKEITLESSSQKLNYPSLNSVYKNSKVEIFTLN